MSKNTILALATGIVIGAAGMWFVDNSGKKDFDAAQMTSDYSSAPMSMEHDAAAPAASTAPAATTTATPDINMNSMDMNMDNTSNAVEDTASAAETTATTETQAADTAATTATQE